MAPPRMSVSPAESASNATPHWLPSVSAGVPDGVDSMQILSPASTETECVVSFPVVFVSEMVQVRVVSPPFFLTVNVRDLPFPGAVASFT